MKKKIKFSLLLTSLGLMLGLTSCKKDRSCECTFAGYTEIVGTYPNSKPSDAKKLCDAYETLLQTEYSDASCKVK